MYTRTLQLDLVNKKHPTSVEAEETCKNTQTYLTKIDEWNKYRHIQKE